jgi:hypothetical protein
VYERIVENPIEDDTPLYRRNIFDETNITNNLERNLLQENLDERHTRTTDHVDYIRSDHLIDESKSSSDLVNQVVIKEDVRSRKDTKVISIRFSKANATHDFLSTETNRQNIHQRNYEPPQGTMHLRNVHLRVSESNTFH